MALIPTKIHAVLDYAGGLGSLAAPRLLNDRRAGAVMGASGVGTLVTSTLTDYELGIRRKLPMPAHLLIDAATGILLLSGAVALKRRGAALLDCGALAVVGLSELAGAALTERRPGDRSKTDFSMPPAPTGVSGGVAAHTSAAAGPPLASPPVETPGPSVTPPDTPESDVERTERVDALRPESEGPPDDDTLVAREESAAAAEAARIGGDVSPEVDDPAMEPVYEAGGGEQEGWEAAEADLIENATHGDGGANPSRDAFSPELEADRSGAVYGEPDRIASTEVLDDDAGPVDV